MGRSGWTARKPATHRGLHNSSRHDEINLDEVERIEI
jgi:hypothetical protein